MNRRTFIKSVIAAGMAPAAVLAVTKPSRKFRIPDSITLPRIDCDWPKLPKWYPHDTLTYEDLMKTTWGWGCEPEEDFVGIYHGQK